jgi:uncharacterized RDD family membrane protein YckC
MSQPPPPSSAAGAGAADAAGTYMGYQLATWSERMGAVLLDLLIAAIPALVAIVTFNPRRQGLNVLLWIAALLVYVFSRWLLQGTSGQSLGKRILHLRLVHMGNGLPVGPSRALVRDLAHMLDMPCLPIGLLMPLWDRYRQTFADKLASTLVLSDAKDAKRPSGPADA